MAASSEAKEPRPDLSEVDGSLHRQKLVKGVLKKNRELNCKLYYYREKLSAERSSNTYYSKVQITVALFCFRHSYEKLDIKVSFSCKLGQKILS